MRGKPVSFFLPTSFSRITPAHAGKTALPCDTARRRRDHPRACGENSGAGRGKRGLVGSPPRMRGKPVRPAAIDRGDRITPAHAGKTMQQYNVAHRSEDHPRACGENRNTNNVLWSLGRITPAHAGKTREHTHPLSAHQDHPRACGENLLEDDEYLLPEGSPPRMRGKLQGYLRRSCPEGITPAHAGKTFFHPCPHKREKDHPRACGENGNPDLKIQGILGSPPRMRGKLFGTISRTRRRRITPAHAGKTSAN